MRNGKFDPPAESTGGCNYPDKVPANFRQGMHREYSQAPAMEARLRPDPRFVQAPEVHLQQTTVMIHSRCAVAFFQSGLDCAGPSLLQSGTASGKHHSSLKKSFRYSWTGRTGKYFSGSCEQMCGSDVLLDYLS